MTAATIDDVLAILRTGYGNLSLVPSDLALSDVFALVLYEQVAYLSDDAVRLDAFATLRERVGVSPLEILSAGAGVLEALCRLGGAIAASERAERMRVSARLMLSQFNGSSAALLALPEAAARRALRQFPMIGEPAADKILALAHRTTRVPLDSNALRVLQRLGLLPGTAAYAQLYRAAQAALGATSDSDAATRLSVGATLRRHGQQCCTRSSPRCSACALRPICPSGRAQ